MSNVKIKPVEGKPGLYEVCEPIGDIPLEIKILSIAICSGKLTLEEEIKCWEDIKKRFKTMSR